MNLGVPNACQNCHQDVSNVEHAKQVSQWFPVSKYRQVPQENFAYAFAQADAGDISATPKLVDLAQSEGIAPMLQASAVNRIAGARNNQDLITFLAQQLKDDDPLVVLAAVRATEQLSLINRSLKLIPVLDHENRAVRMAAGRALAVNLADPSFKGPRRVKLQKAVNEYIDAQHYQADRGSAHTNLGQIYAMTREFGKAESAFKDAIKVEPIFIPSYIYLADLYRQQNQELKAEQALLQALEVNDESSDIYFQLALSKVRQKDRNQAIQYFDKAIKYNDQNPRFFYTRGVLHQENKALVKAKLDYAQAYALQPQTPDYLYSLVMVLVELQEYDSALFHAQKLGQLLPNNPQVQQLMGYIRQLM